MNRQQTKALQQILADAGFYKGTIDGLWGPKSQTAKEAWEAANGKKFVMSDFVIVDSIGNTNLVGYADTLFTYSGATIDADGSPHAYHPTEDKKALDYLAAAGYPGNWWGVLTKNGKFILQDSNDPAPGFCISSTSLKVKGESNLVRRQMDAETIPFIVLPGRAPFAKLGDYGTLWHVKTGAKCHVLFADVGPRTHWGEISYKSALDLALSDPSPKHGGLSKGLIYIVYPKSGHASFNLGEGYYEIDRQYLTKESIDQNAQPLWTALDKQAILTYYGILDLVTIPV